MEMMLLFVAFVCFLINTINGEFTCYRDFLEKRSLCKGPVRKNTHRFNTPEKCCEKKGEGFYHIKTYAGGQKKYVCTPCSALLVTTTERPTPVHGNWGSWSSYTTCSATCGFGNMIRTRECNHPAPAHGGEICRGYPIEYRRCHHRRCPQHGGWSKWSPWSSCPVTCGEGVRHRTRTCDSPKPLFGGDECFGKTKETERCMTSQPCPIDGGWSRWTNYGRCNGPSCGEGTQTRSRSCTNPRARYGGRPCRGFLSETRTCFNEDNCPILSISNG